MTAVINMLCGFKVHQLADIHNIQEMTDYMCYQCTQGSFTNTSVHRDLSLIPVYTGIFH